MTFFCLFKAESLISPSAHNASGFEKLDFPVASVSDGKEVDEPPTGQEEYSMPVSVFQTETSSTSEHYASAFEKLDFPTTSVYDGKEADKPPPPGLEECSVPVSIFQKTKIRPSKMGDPVPLMGKYVALAVCRQRLHDEVLKECKTFVLADALHSSCAVRSALRNDESDGPLDASNQRENLNNVCGNLLSFSSYFSLCHCFLISYHQFLSVLYAVMSMFFLLTWKHLLASG